MLCAPLLYRAYALRSLHRWDFLVAGGHIVLLDGTLAHLAR